MNGWNIETLLHYGKDLFELGAVCLSIIAAWWRFSSWVHKYAAAFEQLQKDVHALTTSNIKMVDSNLDLTKKVVVLETRDKSRDKDVTKLEGALEFSQRTIQALTLEVSKTNAKIDAAWGLLQSMFPEQVPKRISDK